MVWVWSIVASDGRAEPKVGIRFRVPIGLAIVPKALSENGDLPPLLFIEEPWECTQTHKYDWLDMPHMMWDLTCEDK